MHCFFLSFQLGKSKSKKESLNSMEFEPAPKQKKTVIVACITTVFYDYFDFIFNYSKLIFPFLFFLLPLLNFFSSIFI